MTAAVTALRLTAEWVEDLHADATRFFTEADAGGHFVETVWERPGGGGGVSRILEQGATFERAGVNRAVVAGALGPELLARLAAREVQGATQFTALGLSLVAHPRSPRIPTVHLNVRYVELLDDGGALVDAWFGGGTDLTPTWPEPAHARHFHEVLAATCARHDAAYYPRYKAVCDQYFRNRHRNDEARGVGGIFFDHLRAGADGIEAVAAFVDDIGRVLPRAYGPIVDEARNAPWGERERRLQLLRRGRYAEFNLLHDRGTAFGLQSGARTDSVLMSMPPLAAWDVTPEWEPGSIEQRLQDMLVPRNWVQVAP